MKDDMSGSRGRSSREGRGVQGLFKGFVFRCMEKPWLHGPLRRLTLSGVLPAWLWTRMPARGTVDIPLSDGSSFKYKANANDFLDRVFFWRGLQEYEAATFRVFLALAAEADVVLDIGANTGVFSLLACSSNPSSRVIAFEPVPEANSRLAENVRINAWQHRCECRKEAVSSAPGTAKMHVPYGKTPYASLHCEGQNHLDGFLVEVPVVTIDGTLAGTAVDLVKIDVEGHEDKVLEGMRGVLAQSRPLIIVECLCSSPYREVEGILRRFGYRFFQIMSDGLRASPHIVPDEREQDRNWLCCPEDKIPGKLMDTFRG